MENKHNLIPWSNLELTIDDSNQINHLYMVDSFGYIKFDAKYGTIRINTSEPFNIDVLRPSEYKNGMKIRIIGNFSFQGKAIEKFEAMLWNEKWWTKENL